jgi:FHA domain
MSKRGEAARRPARAPLPRRTRKRWLVAAGVAVCWLFLLDVTGSLISATMLLAFLAGLGVVSAAILRALGISRDHPYVRKLSSRPWRDGQEVLQLALRHMTEVLVVTPSGSLIAPDLVELRLNPGDLSSLTERMDLRLIAESAAEVYAEQVAARGARFAGPGPAQVRVIADSAVPQGRYRLRQGQPVDAGRPSGFPFGPDGALPGAHLHDPEFLRPHLAYAAAQPAQAAGPAQAGAPSAVRGSVPAPSAPPAPPGPASPAAPVAPGAPAGPRPVPSPPYPGFVGHDGNTRAQPEPGPRTVTDLPTVIELGRGPAPALRLVTGDSRAETQISGARAGRGSVELRLPDVPTVSREHARFTYSDGQWWIANLGRNGLCLNGSALVGEQPLSNGDSVRWGMRSDALLSRVEIG